jgi:uncharacterized protein (TIGR03000 family)
MSWRSIPLLKTMGLAVAALLFAAGPAAAQRGGHGGGGHGGGASHGGGGSRGASAAHMGSFHGSSVSHAGSFHGSSIHHGNSSHSHNVRVVGFFPGFYGFGLGYAPYYGDSYYPPSYYDVGSAGYYDMGSPGYAMLETPIPYRSFYPPMPADVTQPNQSAAAPADTKAHVRLVVPADAEVWFDGEKTSQTGTAREFVSPPLTLGTDYAYEIRARWMENGKPVDQTRSVTVRAGSLTIVNFTRPSPNK